jgi:HEAT repeat protein
MTNALKPQTDHPDPDPPLADWLVALSHDSPYGRPPSDAVRGEPSPPLAALPSLLSLLQDADVSIRLRAVAALGDLGAEIRRVLPALRRALSEAARTEGDDRVRAEAVRALLGTGPQPATEVGPLVDALHSSLDVVRFHAAVALGDLGAAARPAVPDLIRAACWDEDSAVRVEAAVALWRIEQKGTLAVQVLIDVLEDANEMTCWIAAEHLGRMGPEARDAIPALRRALGRDFRISLIKTGVMLALERIDPQAAGRRGAFMPADERREPHRSYS